MPKRSWQCTSKRIYNPDTFIGFNDADIRSEGVKLFEAHHGIGNILFVDAHEEVALA